MVAQCCPGVGGWLPIWLGLLGLLSSSVGVLLLRLFLVGLLPCCPLFLFVGARGVEPRFSGLVLATCVVGLWLAGLSLHRAAPLFAALVSPRLRVPWFPHCLAFSPVVVTLVGGWRVATACQCTGLLRTLERRRLWLVVLAGFEPATVIGV